MAAGNEQGGLRRVTDRWPRLKDLQPPMGTFGRIDAAFTELTTLFLFSQDQFISLDLESGEIRDGPKQISEGWPGVDFDRIDAVLSTAMDAVYFFHGNQYVRFSMLEGRVLDGYPESISRRWFGVTFDRIDAALYRPETGKAYFFRDDQHIRYDMCTYRADPGYPRAISGSYVEDWRP